MSPAEEKHIGLVHPRGWKLTSKLPRCSRSFINNWICISSRQYKHLEYFRSESNERITGRKMFDVSIHRLNNNCLSPENISIAKYINILIEYRSNGRFFNFIIIVWVASSVIFFFLSWERYEWYVNIEYSYIHFKLVSRFRHKYLFWNLREGEKFSVLSFSSCLQYCLINYHRRIDIVKEKSHHFSLCTYIHTHIITTVLFNCHF